MTATYMYKVQSLDFREECAGKASTSYKASVLDCIAIEDAAKRHAFCKAEPSLLYKACTLLMRCGTERALSEVKMPTYL